MQAKTIYPYIYDLNIYDLNILQISILNITFKQVTFLQDSRVILKLSELLENLEEKFHCSSMYDRMTSHEITLVSSFKSVVTFR